MSSPPSPNPKSLHLFLSTGDVSGDLQSALLIKAIQRQAVEQRIDLTISAVGGDRVCQTGVNLLANTSTISSIGLVESLPYFAATLRIQRRVQQFLRQNPPDVMVMVDYMGPNIGFGKFVRRSLPNTKTVYYIAPQEWVWSINQRNTNLILQMTDRLLAIFPAEAKYYQERGGQVTWIGHPLIDRMASAPSRQTARDALGIDANELAIALLPASRQQELHYILPPMFAAAQQIQARFPDARFWIPLSLEPYRQPVEQAIADYGLRATLVSTDTAVDSLTVLAAADFALTKSGTVNLELALLNVPQVVVYRLNPVTAWLAKHVLKFSIPFASPPNLVLMKPVVPELLQDEVTGDRIAQEALNILENPDRQAEIRRDYQLVRETLGSPGVCDRAAQVILSLLSGKPLPELY